jgi:hypothetical protein
MTTPPLWIEETANRVAELFHSEDPLAPLGCHYYLDEDSDVWEVTLFVSHTETLGGEFDGKLTRGRFSVDLGGLASLFSQIERFSWQAVSMGEGDELGPHLSLEGRVGGENLWLRIASEPPQQFEAGRIADVYDGEFHDRW